MTTSSLFPFPSAQQQGANSSAFGSFQLTSTTSVGNQKQKKKEKKLKIFNLKYLKPPIISKYVLLVVWAVGISSNINQYNTENHV